MNKQDTKLLFDTLKEMLAMRIDFLEERCGIHDPHDDPTGLCVDLSYLISKVEEEGDIDG